MAAEPPPLLPLSLSLSLSLSPPSPFTVCVCVCVCVQYVPRGCRHGRPALCQHEWRPGRTRGAAGAGRACGSPLWQSPVFAGQVPRPPVCPSCPTATQLKMNERPGQYPPRFRIERITILLLLYHIVWYDHIRVQVTSHYPCNNALLRWALNVPFLGSPCPIART
jgi:hypothetical protein